MKMLNRLLGIVLSGAAVAVALAWTSRRWLPYERLGRETPEEQFLVWEAGMWLIGLLMLFFGAAAAFGSLHLMRTRAPGLGEMHAHVREVHQRPLPASAGSLWTIATGVTLLAIAGWARVSFPQ